MSRILYVQPIFAPDKKRLERNIDSLKSMSRYIKTNNLSVPVIFGGWCKNEEYLDEIKKICHKGNFPNLVGVMKFERNYGKAVVVNKLVNRCIEESVEFDYILTADSDIVFKDDTINLFGRLDEVIKQTECKGKFGMISLQQEGNCCHLPMVYKNNLKYKSCFGVEEEVVWPNGKGGIAGGCIFVSRKAWEEVGGYRVMGVYAGDDAYLLIDLMDKGYTVQMFKTLSVIHPHDDDEEYAKWKVKVCQRDSSGGKIKSNIDSLIEESEKFWEK